MKTNLFVSTELSTEHPFRTFCEQHSIELRAVSLIEFKQLNYFVSSNYDVIFFSSIRCYNYFVSCNEISIDSELASIGVSTAKQINENISSFSFIGSTPGNPQKVAEAFKEWLGDRRVLFPLALNSNESISSHIPDDQKEVVRVYETIHHPIQIPEQDTYVFTSPSNVESFLKMNQIRENANVVAWGNSTKRSLEKNHIQVWKTLETSSFDELMSLL